MAQNRDEEPFGQPSPAVDLIVGSGRSDDNARFGDLLVRLRDAAGLSRPEAAAMLDLSSAYLSMIESGRRTPALGQMRKVLDVYGAVGEVERISPQGYRQDLIVIDPINDEPLIVEFTSRIREARRAKSAVMPRQQGDGQPAPPQISADPRLAELGRVIELLTRADYKTLRKIRRLIEDKRV